ncbi:hypothetical protein BHM03_00041561 [Ensete ventricosum]|nr:hypothetical protein BHM03_00041561 [Ensete ventricosum]
MLLLLRCRLVDMTDLSSTEKKECSPRSGTCGNYSSVCWVVRWSGKEMARCINKLMASLVQVIFLREVATKRAGKEEVFRGVLLRWERVKETQPPETKMNYVEHFTRKQP